MTFSGKEAAQSFLSRPKGERREAIQRALDAVRNDPGGVRMCPIPWRLPVLIAEGTIPGRIRPYVRRGKAHWSKAAKAYHESQNRVREAIRGFPGIEDLADVFQRGKRIEVCVLAYIKPTKKGNVPKTAGDADNYFKAVLDAMAYGNKSKGIVPLIPDDNAFYVEGGSHGVYLSEDERVEVAIYEEV